MKKKLNLHFLKLTLLLLISSNLVFCLPAQSKNSCTKNDQCDTSNECCLFSILSFYPIYEISSVGTCTRFLEEEADCTFWALGTCGCRPGLECVDRPFIFPNFNFTFPLTESKGFLPNRYCKRN